MRPIAYIGITGFTSEYEISRVAMQYAKHEFFGRDTDSIIKTHKPMFGFICSLKRLADMTSHGKQSPAAQNLGCLTRYTPRGAIPMIHYFTKDRNNLAEEVKEVFSIDGMYENNYCRALQINMTWPDIKQIEAIRKEFPDMDMVLWMSKEALGEPCRAIESRAIEYKDLVQYCLIDPSGGKGQDIADEHLGLVEILHASMPNTRIGVAGGRDGSNVEKTMEQLYQTITEPFCIDAQGKMRTEDRQTLNFNSTDRYISASAQGIYISK